MVPQRLTQAHLLAALKGNKGGENIMRKLTNGERDLIVVCVVVWLFALGVTFSR